MMLICTLLGIINHNMCIIYINCYKNSRTRLYSSSFFAQLAQKIARFYDTIAIYVKYIAIFAK